MISYALLNNMSSLMSRFSMQGILLLKVSRLHLVLHSTMSVLVPAINPFHKQLVDNHLSLEKNYYFGLAAYAYAFLSTVSPVYPALNCELKISIAVKPTVRK